ncbi:MAG: hypothetical protein U5L96_08275 [Owenweeksia sp.]|nr:hypothetical protein [Owenweeksia sp.]
MRLYITSILTLLFAGLSAQKGSPQSEMLSDNLVPDVQQTWLAQSSVQVRNSEDVEALAALIKNELGYGQNVRLVHKHTRHSKILSHHHFDLYLKDTKVFGGEIHLALSSDGLPKLIQHPDLPLDGVQTTYPPAQVADVIKNNLGAELILAVEPVLVLQSDHSLKGALRVELAGPETLHREVLYRQGEIIYNNDLHKHFRVPAAGPNDTLVSVRVFDPDPLTTAQQDYGGKYVDSNDRNVGAINTQRQQRSTIFSYINGSFVPENDFVKITEFSQPATGTISSNSGQFNFTRNQAGFEDVNTIYHITTFAEHLISMGYGDLPGYQIHVDAHALSGSDQSFFYSRLSLPPVLWQGRG